MDCIEYFHSFEKIPNRNILRKTRSLLLTFEGDIVHSGRQAYWQENEASGHTVFS